MPELIKSHFAKTLLTALALTVGATSLALAQSARSGERDEQRFERMDIDGNGNVTSSEFSQPMIERFTEADADSNGQVTADELAAAIERRRARRMANRMIERFDIDGDNEVTVEELQNRQGKMFALIDRDDSGDVTIEEFRTRPAMGGGRRHGKDHRRGHGDCR